MHSENYQSLPHGLSVENITGINAQQWKHHKSNNLFGTGPPRYIFASCQGCMYQTSKYQDVDVLKCLQIDACQRVEIIGGDEKEQQYFIYFSFIKI